MKRRHKYLRYYNKTNTCDRCGKIFDMSKDPRCERDKEGNWTGKWICKNCYLKDWHRVALLSDRRIGEQNPNHSNTKGDKFQRLTCEWRGVEDLNIKNDNYISPIDHSKDPILGVLQTKGNLYNSIGRTWGTRWERERYKNFDHLIFYCASKDGKKIERVYIFPKKEVEMVSGITIYKNSSRREPWYERYRVKDEDTLKYINKIWERI